MKPTNMARDPYRYFRVEARDLLDQLGKGALEFDKGGAAPELVALMLRLAHTLKGAARVVKQREIADQAHAIEDALAPFREKGNAVSREGIDAVLGALDKIGLRMAELDTRPAGDAAAGPKITPPRIRPPPVRPPPLRACPPPRAAPRNRWGPT